MDRLLEKRTAVVTGGSRGLGLAIARALAVDGASVVVASRSESAALGAAALISAAGGSAATWVGDITRDGATDSLVARAVEAFGGLDIVVHCAGHFLWKPFLEFTPEEWRQVLDTNLTSAFVLTQSAARAMIDGGRGGAVIHMGSIHGVLPEPNVVAQCAAKAGVVGLVRAAAEALRPYDIRVNGVAPGSVDPDSADRRGESPRDKVTQADVATLVVYLASDVARSITGAVFDVFGNTRVQIRS